jgi:hypothetical protein
MDLKKGQRVKVARRRGGVQPRLVGLFGTVLSVRHSADRRTGIAEIVLDQGAEIVSVDVGALVLDEDARDVRRLRAQERGLQAWESEWSAWRQVCKHLGKLGIDVNAEATKPLVMAMRWWGEELARLRTVQSSEIVDPPDDPLGNPLGEARENYRPFVLEDDEEP